MADYEQRPLVDLKESLVKSTEESSSSHQCHRGDGHGPWLRRISQWYLLFIYLAYTLAFTIAMLFGLDGKLFTIADPSAPRMAPYRLTQTDMATIISSGLVLARFIGSSWQAIAAWRCLFILLEKTGLSLSEASWMASKRLPPSSMFNLGRRQNPKLGDRQPTVKLFTILILILAWPAQLASPLANGAVSWIPSSVHDTETMNVKLPLGLPSTVNPHPWSWYKRFSEKREELVKQSAGWSTLGETANPLAAATTDRNHSEAMPIIASARRMLPQLRSYPNGTAVQTAILPVFSITSFSWVTNLTTLPDKVLLAIRNRHSGYLNFTQAEGPLAQTTVGVCSLLKESPWVVPPTDGLPKSSIFEGTKYAAVYISRHNNNGEGPEYDCRAGNSDFDPLPPGAELVNNFQGNNHSDCIAVAELGIRAGVTRCQQSSSVTAPESACLSTFGTLNSTSEAVTPDPLVFEVFAMMPEVQALVAAFGLYDPGSLGGNLELFVRNSLIQTYQGTWSTLAHFLRDPDPEPTNVWEPREVLEARVSRWRMWLWMGINLLLFLSGVLLIAMQSACEGKTVNDPVVTAMMMDSSDVIQSDNTGLCNATDIGTGHGNSALGLVLHVKRNGPEYYHPKLVAQNPEANVG